MDTYHKELASGGWNALTLPEQMANIGSEVHRAITWFKKKDKERFQNAFYRALELFDLTLEDIKLQGRRKEIARSREVFCELLINPEYSNNLNNELASFDNYFLQFGMFVRLKRDL